MPRVLSPEARESNRKRCNKWYYANKEYARECQERRVQRNLAIIREAKQRPCVDCGGQFPSPAMHLDHVRGQKHLPVARMKSYSEARIRAEIAKCEVRCANCHAIRTWPEA